MPFIITPWIASQMRKNHTWTILSQVRVKELLLTRPLWTRPNVGVRIPVPCSLLFWNNGVLFHSNG